MKYTVFILLSLSLFSCTSSLHISHVSDFAPTYRALNQGQVVQSRAEQSVFLGFVTDTNFVNEAYNKLQQTCSGGAIQGITTQYSTNHGFLSWTNYVEMQGLCVK
jgi:hypothetical protein